MESKRDYEYYKKHASCVELEDITSSESNREFLRRLRDNDSDLDFMYISGYAIGHDEEFVVEDGDDLGWLGYFVGESKTLGCLGILNCDLPPGNSLVEGICRNRSIECLEITNDLGDYPSLISSLQGTLNELILQRFTVADFPDLATVLGQTANLPGLTFESANFSGDASVLTKVLSKQTQLKSLKFEFCDLDHDPEMERKFCTALSTTFVTWGDKAKLQSLNLSCNGINDEGMEILVEGIASCRNLNLIDLDLSGNELATVGLTSLSCLFREDGCCVENLNLCGMRMDDDGIEALASGLVDYKLLKILELSENNIGDRGVAALVSGVSNAVNANLESLSLSENAFSAVGIRSLSTLIRSNQSKLQTLLLRNDCIRTDSACASILADALVDNTSLLSLDIGHSLPEGGVESFSRLLCDASSINNIYLSNHTLEIVGWSHLPYPDIEKYCDLNTRYKPCYRYLVPMIKILIHYPHLDDMTSFFQWKLKFLPLVVNWFNRASVGMEFFQETAEEFQCRKLSAVYKFIRGVPLLVANGYWNGRLKHVRMKKRQLEEEEKLLMDRLGCEKRVAI